MFSISTIRVKRIMSSLWSATKENAGDGAMIK